MESSQGGRVPNRGRDRASIALAVIGSLLAVAAVLLLYARAEIIDEDSFADNAVEALADDRVRDVATTEIVVQLVERGSADLIAARPLVEQVVATVVDTAPFRPGLPRGGPAGEPAAVRRGQGERRLQHLRRARDRPLRAQLDQPTDRRRDPQGPRPEAGEAEGARVRHPDAGGRRPGAVAGRGRADPRGAGADRIGRPRARSAGRRAAGGGRGRRGGSAGRDPLPDRPRSGARGGDRRGRGHRRGAARRRSPGSSTPSSAACSSGASL